MDSSLLAVLRHLERNCPPRYQHLPLQGALLWEVFKDIVAVLCTPTKFILDYDAGAIVMTSDTQKTKEARVFIANLLGDARFDSLSYRKRIPLFSFIAASLFLKRHPGKVLRRYSWIRRRYPVRIARDFLKSIVYQAIAERPFSRRPPAALAIVSDLNLRRIAFAKAAHRSGATVIYYQYGQHQSYRPPFHVDYGICINNLLADRLKQKFGSTIINRPTFEGTPEDLVFQPIPEKPVIGIVTNVFPCSEAINETADQLHGRFNASRVYYKPHPRNTEDDIRDIRCEIFDKTVPAETFSNQIDLCICGDTTAVLKILLSGTSCLYLPGLDGRPCDTYGYVKDAAILGAERIEDVSIEDINHFYGASESLNMIRHYIIKNMIIDESWDEKRELIRKMKELIGCR